jgi:hypothetical protein
LKAAGEAIKLGHRSRERRARDKGEIWAMKIRVSDPSLVDDLLTFLQRGEYLVEQQDLDTVEASPRPRSLRSDVARAELDRYLRNWEVDHPEAEAKLLD